MRFRLLPLALGALLLGGTAQANTISFGAMNSGGTSCSQSGNSGDRSCSHTGSVNNGALDNVASANVRGQASADHGITTNPTAIADITIVYDIPYTVTRTVSWSGGGPGVINLSVPTQQITFNVNWSGEVAKDNSQVGGGLGQARAFDASFQSLGGLFSTTNYAGASQTGGGGLARTTVNRTTPDPSFNAGVNFSGAAVGEISFAFEIPTDYRAWTDLLPPTAFDYTVPGSVTQTFTDTLRVSFRLRAESRPSGSISTTGGEAIACFGQTSSLGSFALDNGGNCGSGFDINATTTVTGTALLANLLAVPEPSTLVLLGAALAGLATFGRRRD